MSPTGLEVVTIQTRPRVRVNRSVQKTNWYKSSLCALNACKNRTVSCVRQ